MIPLARFRLALSLLLIFGTHWALETPAEAAQKHSFRKAKKTKKKWSKAPKGKKHRAPRKSVAEPVLVAAVVNPPAPVVPAAPEVVAAPAAPPPSSANSATEAAPPTPTPVALISPLVPVAARPGVEAEVEPLATDPEPV